MNHMRGTKLLVSLVALFLFALQVSASSECCTLTIYTDNTGMAVPQGRQLYVKISASGQMTYLDKKKERYYSRKRSLTKTELARLQAHLQNPALSAISGVQRAVPSPGANDFSTDLQVIIGRGRTEQKIQMFGYTGCPGHDYPAPVRELLQVVDELRASAYRLSDACPPTTD